MAKTTKRLLLVAIASLVVGLIFVTGMVNVQNAVALYVALPLGAVFLGLFLILRIFEKEAALYDQEQQAHPALTKAAVAVNQKPDHSGRGYSMHRHGHSLKH